MSEKYVPKKGDRVRVVLEGEAQPYPDGFYIGPHGENFILPRQAHVVSVEKIVPPLPTAYGSVIRFRLAADSPSHTGYYTLGPKGWKRYGDSEPVRAISLSGDEYEVLFDAGKDA